GASGQTIVAVAGSLDLTPDAALSPRLAASGVTPRAALLPAAEALLATRGSDPNAVEAVATAAARELPFQVEHFPAGGYRRRLLAEGARAGRCRGGYPDEGSGRAASAPSHRLERQQRPARGVAGGDAPTASSRGARR